MYNQCGFVERNKVCGIVSSPQNTTLYLLCASWKQTWVVWPVVFLFLAGFVSVMYSVLRQFQCLKSIHLYFLKFWRSSSSCSYSPSWITALIHCCSISRWFSPLLLVCPPVPFQPAKSQCSHDTVLIFLTAWIIYSWPGPSGKCSAVNWHYYYLCPPWLSVTQYQLIYQYQVYLSRYSITASFSWRDQGRPYAKTQCA